MKFSQTPFGKGLKIFFKIFAIIGAAIAAIFIAKKIVAVLSDLKGTAPVDFAPGSDPQHIAIKHSDGTYENVALPTTAEGKQLTYSDVAAAGISEGQVIHVKVNQEKITLSDAPVDPNTSMGIK